MSAALPKKNPLGLPSANTYANANAAANPHAHGGGGGAAAGIRAAQRQVGFAQGAAMVAMDEVRHYWVANPADKRDLVRHEGEPESYMKQVGDHDDGAPIYSIPPELWDDGSGSEYEPDGDEGDGSDGSGSDADSSAAAAASTPAAGPPRLTKSQLVHVSMWAAGMPAAETPAPPKETSTQHHTLYDGSRRPTPLNIKTHAFKNKLKGTEGQRVHSVGGIVYPMGTEGRANAPEPVSGYRCSTSKASVKNTGSVRNNGAPDVQKGHVVALQLGGADIPQNIAPQWGNWQANGAWKKMETAIKVAAEKAKACGNVIHLTITANYKGAANSAIATHKSQMFPSSFTIHAEERTKAGAPFPKGFLLDTTMDQAQDATDDAMMFRADARAEEQAGQPSSYTAAELRRDKKKPAGNAAAAAAAAAAAGTAMQD